VNGLVRWRCRYSKLGKLRFTGHRDVARLWERALRAAQIPVALSAGFTPRPRLSFGLALPTGAESHAEYLDVIVDQQRLAPGTELDEAWLVERVAAVLPPGLTFDAALALPYVSTSLQDVVVATSWELSLRCEPGVIDAHTVADAVERVMAAEELPLERERKGTIAIDDVRPSIEMLTLQHDAQPLELSAVLLTHGRALRPSELVRALVPGCDPAEVLTRVLRTQQWIDDDGARREVQPAAGVPKGTRGGTTWTPPTPPPAPNPSDLTSLQPLMRI
jgi:radical SAM-linked protein